MSIVDQVLSYGSVAPSLPYTNGGIRLRTTVDKDYMNEDKGSVLIGVSVGCALATTLVLAGQFYSKRFGAATLGLDDAFLSVAYIVNLSMCALGISKFSLSSSKFVL